MLYLMSEPILARVLTAYRKELEEVERDVFDGIPISEGIRDALYSIVPLMFDKEWIHPAEDSVVVIAGMGEDEAFTGLVKYGLGNVAAGKLRYSEGSRAIHRRRYRCVHHPVRAAGHY